MGDCGSKLDFMSVKEQRVNGSWHKFFMFKMHSKGFRNKLSIQNPFIKNNNFIGFNNNLISHSVWVQRRGISNISIKPETSLSALWLTGYVDAEGSFIITVVKNSKT